MQGEQPFKVIWEVGAGRSVQGQWGSLNSNWTIWPYVSIKTEPQTTPELTNLGLTYPLVSKEWAPLINELRPVWEGEGFLFLFLNYSLTVMSLWQTWWCPFPDFSEELAVGELGRLSADSPQPSALREQVHTSSWAATACIMQEHKAQALSSHLGLLWRNILAPGRWASQSLAPTSGLTIPLLHFWLLHPRRSIVRRMCCSLRHKVLPFPETCSSVSEEAGSSSPGP